MKIAIIGSRSLQITDFREYLPSNTTEIITGDAKGIDTCAKTNAKQNGLKVTEFLPEYSRYKKGAPLKRNLKIIAADFVLAFWDGKSRGTKYVIEQCKKQDKPIRVIML
ncbi:MAG: hypothetical protein ACI4K9_07405 [Candidatus Fimenecus sp.]